MNATEVPIYCDLKDLKMSYKKYHIYLAITVCIFGSITNILNIFVLNTKVMRSSTNYILMALAASDLLVMLEYIPFVYLFNYEVYNMFHFTYSFAAFIIFHAFYTQAFHFTSCCLTVILAIWRYVAIKFPHHNAKYCNEYRTKWTILLTYIICPLVCTPVYFSIQIYRECVPTDLSGKFLPPDNFTHVKHTNQTIYRTNYVNEVLKDISFYVYGVIIKLIPCILLTVLSALLIIGLLEAKKRRRNLMQSGRESTKKVVSQKHIEKEKQADRTTRMLLVVLLLFLMVEFPQAIFGVLNHLIGEEFDAQCYQPLGDIIDIVALTNSSINFVLYCTMSKKFREVFKEIILAPFPCFKFPSEKWYSMQTIKTDV